VRRGPRIGIYVHHHGGGHAARTGAIGAALLERGAAVTYLSSLPPRRLGPGEVVTLPLDTDLGSGPGAAPAELHFAPLGSAGLAGRMAMIADWIAAKRPDLVLVDVSVEVAMLARLCGVRFAYLRQSGRRQDPPHRLAYRWATTLLAPYPEWLEPVTTPAWMREKTGHVGAVTRFDGRPRPAVRGRARRAVVLGEGAEELAATIAAMAPGWQVLGPRPVDLDLLASCAVVVAPAGANTVAESAFARCGLVCIPRPRPFDEQVARGADLARHRSAVVLPVEETVANWSRLLEEARSRRHALAEWADGGGADRAADHLLGPAAGSSVPATSSVSVASSHATIPSPASSASQPVAGQVPQRSR
jgi:hypothetical protein